MGKCLLGRHSVHGGIEQHLIQQVDPILIQGFDVLAQVATTPFWERGTKVGKALNSWPILYEYIFFLQILNKQKP